MEIQKQRVWRTVSKPDHNGFFIWDILEVMDIDQIDKTSKAFKTFVECRDGSYILIQCYHFWTQESIGKFFKGDEDYSVYQIIINV
jgi:hypothetical protein